MSSSLGFSVQFVRSMFSMHPRRQLREMYVFLLLFSFAASLITIFEPVFFYQAGFSLSLISAFYGIHYTLYIFLLPVGAKFAARFGYERSLTASTPVFVLYFLLLASIPNIPQLFWIAPIVLTLFKILYWPAYHANFAAFADTHNRGTEQSWIRMVSSGAGVIGPTIGGFLVVAFGFSALFVLAAALVAAAGVPLLRTNEKLKEKKFTYWSAWEIIFARRHRRMVLSMIGFGENLVHLVYWPVFIFLAVDSAQLLGVIASASMLITAFWGFIVGEMTDRWSPRRVLKLFVPLTSLSYVFRLFAHVPLTIAGADAFARTSQTSISIPFVAKLYQTGRGVGALKYAVAFEIVLAIFKALVAWVFVVVFLYVTVPTGLALTFAVAGVLALFYLFL